MKMTKNIIFSKVEKAVKTMINKFGERPGEFVSENDLHCYMYHVLYDAGINEVDKKLILHKEYPSCLNRGNKKKRKGHFDMIIFNPELLDDKKVMIAMEFKLIKNNSKRYIELIEKDLEQISEEVKNGVNVGYVFVFSQIDYKKIHKDKILTMLKNHSTNVKGYYIQMKNKEIAY